MEFEVGQSHAERPRRVGRALKVVAWSAAAVAAMLAILLVVVAVVWSRADTSNVGELSFERPLPVPELLEPREVAGRKVFELEMREGTTELLAGTRTPTWGFNGPYLGPTLRASRGDEVELRVTNALPESSTVHWHGMHLPAVADGGPHQPIEPGETWTPRWTIDQPAATLWYHPHPHGNTDEHVYRGLAGMFIVDDPAAADQPLPDDYGIDDVPVIVQDKRFEDDGRLSTSQGMISPLGRLGDQIVVNGVTDPHLDVETTRIRLRLLNASTARPYNFGFSDGREFALVATDGGLLPAPERMERVQLSPGERAEIVVEMTPGEKVVLRSYEPDLGDTDFFNARFSGGDDTFDVLQLRARSDLRESPALPPALAPPMDSDATDARRVRRFELDSRSINNEQMDPSRIDQTVRAGTTEIWEVHNRGGIPHNFHPHGVSFEVVEFDGAPPPPALEGFKDTVFVPPGVTVRLLTTFRPYSDPRTPYMFHCHLLRHEDQGMMGQFVVVDRGEEARLPRHDHGH